MSDRAPAGSEMLRIRFQAQSDFSEMSISLQGLTDAIVRGDTIPPNAVIFMDGGWVAIWDCAHRPWLDVLVERAVKSAERGKATDAEQNARKVLRYAGEHRRGEQASVAAFLLGSLHMAKAELELALAWFGCVTGAKALRAAALSNMGVASALLCEPSLAVDRFLEAHALQPDLVYCDLSLFNLAQTMIQEHAPSPSGGRTWRKLATDANVRVRRFTRQDYDAATGPSSGFPNYRFMHVFERKRYLPAISSRMSADNPTLASGRRLLLGAEHAMEAERLELAIQLANQAATTCAELDTRANVIAHEAMIRLQSRVLLRTAERIVANHEEVDNQISQMSPTELASPLEALALAALVTDSADELYKVYEQRIRNVVQDSLDKESDPAKKRRLMAVLAIFSHASSVQSLYRQASAHVLAKEPLGKFWQGLVDGEKAQTIASLESLKDIAGFPADVVARLELVAREANFES